MNPLANGMSLNMQDQIFEGKKFISKNRAGLICSRYDGADFAEEIDNLYDADKDYLQTFLVRKGISVAIINRRTRICNAGYNESNWLLLVRQSSCLFNGGISNLPRKYQMNFYDQRKAYLSAESIQRSISEVYEDGENQFDILKEDAFGGIKTTYYDDLIKMKMVFKAQR